jgi:hypothetical protein
MNIPDMITPQESKPVQAASGRYFKQAPGGE